MTRSGASRRRWCRATCASRWPSASAPTARSSRPLDAASVDARHRRRARRRASRRSPSACIIAYANPVHEQAIGARLRAELPGRFVSLSTEVLPEIREYERTSTTVVNAYVGPPVRHYLSAMIGQLAAGRRQGPPARHAVHRRHAVGRRAPPTGRPRSSSAGPPPASSARASSARAARLRQHHHLRHGRHDRQGLADRARRCSHVRASTRSAAACRRSSPLMKRRRLRAQAARHRRRRRSAPAAAASCASTQAAPSRSARESAGAVPGPPATAAAARSRPSPTPTSCWAILNPERACRRHGADRRRRLARRAIAKRIADPLGLDARRGRVRHPSRGQRHHDARGQGASRPIAAATRATSRSSPSAATAAFTRVACARAADPRVVVPPPPACSARSACSSPTSSSTLAAPSLRRIAALSPGPSWSQSLRRRSKGRSPRDWGVRAQTSAFQRRAELRYAGQGFELRAAAEPRSTTGARRARTPFDAEHGRTLRPRASRTYANEVVHLRVVGSVTPRGRRRSRVARSARAIAPVQARQAYFGPQHGLLDTPVLRRAAPSTSKPRAGPAGDRGIRGHHRRAARLQAALDADGNIVIDARQRHERAVMQP